MYDVLNNYVFSVQQGKNVSMPGMRWGGFDLASARISICAMRTLVVAKQKYMYPRCPGLILGWHGATYKLCLVVVKMTRMQELQKLWRRVFPYHVIVVKL